MLGYADAAKLYFHPENLDDYRWRIEPLERYENRAPRLVQLIEVAAPGAPASWEAFQHLPASAVSRSTPPDLIAQKHRELVKGAGENDIMAMLNWLHISLTLAPDEEFVAAALLASYPNLNELVEELCARLAPVSRGAGFT